MRPEDTKLLNELLQESSKYRCPERVRSELSTYPLTELGFQVLKNEFARVKRNRRPQKAKRAA
jgi:hypothetical protein